MQAHDVLVGARDRVQSGWCQRCTAEDDEGAAVEPWSDAARRWSLLGAIVATVDAPAAGDDREMPLSELALAMGALALVIDETSLADWNDAPQRTQADIVAALERAIGLVDAGEVPLWRAAC